MKSMPVFRFEFTVFSWRFAVFDLVEEVILCVDSGDSGSSPELGLGIVLRQAQDDVGN